MRRDQIEALEQSLGRQEVADLLELHDAYARLTEPYRGPGGNDVLAPGPELGPQRMLDDAARALGWRTDFASGGSPITWDLALAEIRRLSSRTSSETRIWLVLLQDEEDPSEPDVGLACHLGGEDGAHAIGKEMEAVMRLAGRGRCVHRVREVTAGNLYRVTALLHVPQGGPP